MQNHILTGITLNQGVYTPEGKDKKPVPYDNCKFYILLPIGDDDRKRGLMITEVKGPSSLFSKFKDLKFPAEVQLEIQMQTTTKGAMQLQVLDGKPVNQERIKAAS